MVAHCKHNMIPECCGICRGLVTRDNQTREYGAGPMLSSRGLTGFMPRANREPLPLRESTEDIVPLPGGRAPTEEEMRETEQEQPHKEGEMEEIDPARKCPRGDHETNNFLTSGKPGVCSSCRSATQIKIQRARVAAKSGKPAFPEPDPALDFPEIKEGVSLKDNMNNPSETAETPIDLSEVKALVDAHWRYVENLLRTHGEPDASLNKIGFHYKSAMLHGYKHGMEAASEQGEQ